MSINLLRGAAIAADIRVENTLTYINDLMEIDRSYQRVYGNEEVLTASLTNGMIESGLKVFKQGLKNGISFGEVGTKKISENKYSVPGGQHRRIFIQMFALQTLKYLKPFKSEFKEYEELKGILFVGGDLEDRAESFKTKLVNEKTSDKEDFEFAIKVIGDFMSSKSSFIKEDIKEEVIKKNQYLLTFSQIGTMIADQEEILDFTAREYALFLFGCLKNTWVIRTYLQEEDSEAEYYKNSFNPNRVESEADRSKIVSITSSSANEREELMKLIEHSNITSEKLFSKGSKSKEVAAFMKVAIMNIGDTPTVITLRPGYSNSVSNVLMQNYKNGLSPIHFYVELQRLFELQKILKDTKTNSPLHSKLRMLSLFINNIGEAKYRHLAIFMHIVEKLVKNNNFASFKDTYNWFNLMASYVLNRSVVLGGNTEKQADEFFFRLFQDIKNLNKDNLSDITNYMKNRMLQEKLIFNKKMFFSRLNDKKFTNNKKLFVIAKSLSAVKFLHDGDSVYETHLMEASDSISSYRKANEVEHFISQEASKVLAEIRNSASKSALLEKVKDFIDSPANLFYLNQEINKKASNDSLGVKFSAYKDNMSLIKDYSLLKVLNEITKKENHFLSQIKSADTFAGFFKEFLVKSMNEVLEAGMVFAD